ITTDEFATWFDGLDEVHVDPVIVGVSKLEQQGVALGHPASSAIKGASFALRELRIKSSGHALRVFYAFDPRRNAVLIIGGDKTGVSSDDFYTRMIARSEKNLERISRRASAR
ncbi:MAG: type II toxin-antitoxin system RelE/ParE family toxin, partial [Polyangia bacterium]